MLLQIAEPNKSHLRSLRILTQMAIHQFFCKLYTFKFKQLHIRIEVAIE